MAKLSSSLSTLVAADRRTLTYAVADLCHPNGCTGFAWVETGDLSPSSREKGLCCEMTDRNGRRVVLALSTVRMRVDGKNRIFRSYHVQIDGKVVVSSSSDGKADFTQALEDLKALLAPARAIEPEPMLSAKLAVAVRDAMTLRRTIVNPSSEDLAATEVAIQLALNAFLAAAIDEGQEPRDVLDDMFGAGTFDALVSDVHEKANAAEVTALVDTHGGELLPSDLDLKREVHRVVMMDMLEYVALEGGARVGGTFHNDDEDGVQICLETSDGRFCTFDVDTENGPFASLRQTGADGYTVRYFEAHGMDDAFDMLRGFLRPVDPEVTIVEHDTAPVVLRDGSLLMAGHRFDADVVHAFHEDRIHGPLRYPHLSRALALHAVVQIMTRAPIADFDRAALSAALTAHRDYSEGHADQILRERRRAERDDCR